MEELKTFEQIFAASAQALSDAVAKHGPDAVELGLVVYRLEGLKVVGMGAVVVVITTAALYALYRVSFGAQWAWAKKTGAEPLYVLNACAALSLIVLWGDFLFDALSIYHWAAAIGYPEVLIAYKALSAAGLM